MFRLVKQRYNTCTANCLLVQKIYYLCNVWQMFFYYRPNCLQTLMFMVFRISVYAMFLWHCNELRMYISSEKINKIINFIYLKSIQLVSSLHDIVMSLLKVFFFVFEGHHHPQNPIIYNCLMFLFLGISVTTIVQYLEL